jgi:hypothetical protein
LLTFTLIHLVPENIYHLFDNHLTSIKDYLHNIPQDTLAKLVMDGKVQFTDIKQAFFHNEEMDKAYDKIAEKMNSVEFDPRIFLRGNDDSIGTITLLSSAPVYQLSPEKYYNDSENRGGAPEVTLSQPTVKPQNIMQATLLSIQLLQSKVEYETAVPDATLIRFFTSCDMDLTEDITTRVNKFVDLLPMDNLAEQSEVTFRKNLIKRIYYQVLKDMLIGEEKRLKKSNFTTLLANDNFHKSHVICSAETLLFAYNCKDCVEFSELLKAFDLEPFELSVVIESFVHHAHWLNSAFKRHFRTIEERLLDSLAWRYGSILYSKLAQQQDSIPPPQPGCETPLHKKRSRVFSVYSNGNNSEQNNQQSKSSSSSGSLATQLFFRKIYRLVSQRISDLFLEFNKRAAENRTISSDIMRQVWHIVWYVLNQRSILMEDRHADHIILCSMYAVCNKVNRMTWLSFKDITHNYRCVCENNRNISPVEVGKILWQVTLSEENKSGDIVKFYNNVFIPIVKDFILQMNTTKDKGPDMPSSYESNNGNGNNNSNNAMLSPSKLRVSKSAKVFVSPMRSPMRSTQILMSPNSQLMSYSLTPRTRALYSFKDAYTEKIIGPTTTTATTSMPLLTAPSSAKRVLDFSDAGESTDSPRKFRRLQSSTSARRSINFGDEDAADTEDTITNNNNSNEMSDIAN